MRHIWCVEFFQKCHKTHSLRLGSDQAGVMGITNLALKIWRENGLKTQDLSGLHVFYASTYGFQMPGELTPEDVKSSENSVAKGS